MEAMANTATVLSRIMMSSPIWRLPSVGLRVDNVVFFLLAWWTAAERPYDPFPLGVLG
jgi:hypothetical protein